MTHPMDLLKIAVITWAAVFFGNKVLKAAGLPQFCATCSAQSSS